MKIREIINSNNLYNAGLAGMIIGAIISSVFDFTAFLVFTSTFSICLAIKPHAMDGHYE